MSLRSELVNLTDYICLLFVSFVLYFSTLCNDADEGKKLIKAAMDALLTLPGCGNSESIPIVQSDSADVKPNVLWSALYIQKLTTVCF